MARRGACLNLDVIVVGGGAAGIIAAWRAATLGAQVVVLEKTNRIGTKILVSGGGKCNVAHDGPLEEVLRAFRPNEARFIRPACYRFTNAQIVELMTSRGLRVYTRPDGRVFPVDQTAKDVVAILTDLLVEAGVDVRLESPVTGLIIEDGVVKGVRFRRVTERARREESRPGASGYRAATATNLLRELGPASVAVTDEEFELRADRVIVCAGGSSYPNSGTTGDGFAWARSVGHTVQPIRAALAPIYLDPVVEARSGIALRDVVLKARQGKEIARWRGDLLFTHQGVSGPNALGISRIVDERIAQGDIGLEVDCRPDRPADAIAAEILAAAQAQPRRLVATLVETFLPERLVGDLLDTVGLARDLPLGRLEKKLRNRLAETLKAWPIGRVRHVPLEKGEVVAGGVSLDEVDPHTMRSKKVPGLFLCGEVLDVAGPVGGYNLQAAFATGYVAGESAATLECGSCH
ncbi:MAG: NAD(P)/FAD-dependent oxidoreductase [Fimbriimonas sp.]